MKTINLYIQICFLVLAALAITGCEDFLEEENRTNLTDQNAFDDPEVFGQLVVNAYEKMRKASDRFKLDNMGTDIITRGAIIAGTDELNDYVNLNPENTEVRDYWKEYYDVVTAANLAISRADDIPDLSEAEISLGLGEVRFFRAFAYFKLVEQYGDVPLVLDEITSAQTDFTRTAESEVYAQILEDLDDAIANVEEAPEQYGRVSKDAARHLKAKVLLTRGYKSFAAANDFADAAALAETVIGKHPLVSDFASLTDIENQRNDEVIFAMLYGTDQLAIGDGNSRHQHFKFDYDIYPGMERSNIYGRSSAISPTPFYFTLFEDGDERETTTLRRMLPALIDSEDGTILAGDTAIYFPEIPFTDEEKAARPFPVVNEGDYFTPNGISQVQHPMFKKFDDPMVPYGDGGGFRDAVIFRSGETRLIAAEAYFNDGNATSAATHINALRNRAGLGNIAPGNIDIDLILDESAKELAGEVSRWMELKRTGKLLERALAHNPHVALNNALREFHLVRPIPQSEIDLTNGSIGQNDDY